MISCKLKFLIVIFALCALAACNDKPDVDQSKTEELLKCIYFSAEKAGVNLDSTLNAYEAFLVSEKFLADTTGQSYFDVYKAGADAGYIKIPEYNAVFPDMFTLMPCYFVVSGDKGARDEIKFFKIWEEIQAGGGFNDKTVCTAISRNLDPEDFEKPFYRMVSLFSFNHIQNNKSRELPISL